MEESGHAYETEHVRYVLHEIVRTLAGPVLAPPMARQIDRNQTHVFAEQAR